MNLMKNNTSYSEAHHQINFGDQTLYFIYHTSDISYLLSTSLLVLDIGTCFHRNSGTRDAK